MLAKKLALFQELSAALVEAEKREPVVEPIEAHRLFKTLDLRLEDKGCGEDRLKLALRDLVLNTPRTASDQFFNQLFGGRNAYAVLGDLLAVMLNNSMYTYKVAGPMVGVEKEIIRQVVRLLGFPASADGTIAPGGSMSNMMAMLMARDCADPDLRYRGLKQKLFFYTSEESHYSLAKNAAFIGIGRDQLRFIPTDAQGRMDVDLLAEQIEKDQKTEGLPAFVNATAGTTVMGAFDNIEAIADLCAEQNIWLHVDGAYCGAVLFSDEYRFLIQGIERVDSFSVNAHKMLATPLTCSIVVTRDKKHLHRSFANEADYLYQTGDDEFNLGKISLQCGRRNDALKFWTLWKAVGTEGLGEMVEHQFHLADVARRYVSNHPDYTLYSYPHSIGICFNYKNIPAETLCNRLYEKGRLMVGYGDFQDTRFVRLVTVNAGNDEEAILNFFHELEAFAAEELPETTKA